MKTKLIALALIGFAALLLQACIAFPPLVQVEHKDTVSNQEIMKRLDAIDHRLNQLEKTEKTEKTKEQEREEK